MTQLIFSIGGFGGECHEVHLKRGKLSYRHACGAYMWEPAVTLPFPSEEAWARFWEAVERVGVWRWNARYFNSDVLDGTQWSLKLKHQDKSLSCDGSNDYPGCNDDSYSETSEFGQFVQALRELTGQQDLG